MSNTRLSRRAQLIRIDAEQRGVSSCGSSVAFSFFWASGMISERSLALGASMPWKRMRLSRGRGTKAAKCCMNYSGYPALRPSGQPPVVQNRSRLYCQVAPSRCGWSRLYRGLLSCSTTSPAGLSLRRSLAKAGRVM